MSRLTSKALALFLVGLGSTAWSQTVHRDTKVTGPRGKTAERSIDIKRTPNSIQRDVKITRPGGATYERETEIRRAGGGAVHTQSRSPGYPGGGGGGPRVIERDVIVRNNYYGGPPAPRSSGSFNLFLGGFAPPPPPLVIVPEPVYIAPAPPPTVVVQPPVRYVPPAEPETVLVDPVAQAIDRLQSHHANSRRDGALTLGRLGDARAVGPLSERLQKDWDKDVRVAAAWALGEIGAPNAGLALQRASLYDKKQEVRDVSEKAISKLNRPIDDPNVQVIPQGATVTPSSTTELAPLPSGVPRSLDPPPTPHPPIDYPK